MFERSKKLAAHPARLSATLVASRRHPNGQARAHVMRLASADVPVARRFVFVPRLVLHPYWDVFHGDRVGLGSGRDWSHHCHFSPL